MHANGPPGPAHAQGSAELPNALYLLRNATTYSPGKVGFASIGKALTDAKELPLYNAVRRFGVAVGAVA